MHPGVRIGKSFIHGLGIFATKKLGEGEVVLRWDTSKVVGEASFQSMTREQSQYVAHKGSRFFLLTEPVKFMNHSCEPNTKPGGLGVEIATRNISQGEEITSDYLAVDTPYRVCRCGSVWCAGLIANL